LLEEVRGHASGVTAAMVTSVAMLMSAATGSDIILHANQSVGMMMMGNDGYHQHY
jgi:hypothetical protein